MQPSTRKVITGVLVAASALSLGAVGWYAWQQRRQLLGDSLITKTTAPPRLVDSTKVGDAEIRHYRSSKIPIDQRVRLIQDRVFKSVTKDPRMRELAAEITKGCRSRDNLCEARAIYEAVRRRVRYVGDVAPIRLPDGNVEPIDFFQSAYRTWKLGMGDCDDHAGLIATLLSLMGITARLRVTAPSKWSDWAHIYGVAEIGRKTYALDTTLEPPTKFGHEIRFAKKRDYVPFVKDYAA